MYYPPNNRRHNPDVAFGSAAERGANLASTKVTSHF
jgi:hypothetical protein